MQRNNLRIQMPSSLLDHLVRAGEQRRRHVKPNDLAVLRLITNSELVARRTGRSAARAGGVSRSEPKTLGSNRK